MLGKLEETVKQASEKRRQKNSESPEMNKSTDQPVKEEAAEEQNLESQGVAELEEMKKTLEERVEQEGAELFHQSCLSVLSSEDSLISMLIQILDNQITLEKRLSKVDELMKANYNALLTRFPEIKRKYTDQIVNAITEAETICAAPLTSSEQLAECQGEFLDLAAGKTGFGATKDQGLANDLMSQERNEEAFALGLQTASGKSHDGCA